MTILPPKKTYPKEVKGRGYGLTVSKTPTLDSLVCFQPQWFYFFLIQCVSRYGT